MNFISEYYLWIKALHVISVVAWMAGLFYLPRLFIYHCEAKQGGELDLTLQTMERRLLKIIMNPAMVLSWIFGGLMVAYYYLNDDFAHGWLHTKLMMVVILTVMHHMCMKYRKDFLAYNNRKTQKYYRIFNEIPTICLIVIVIMVIVKPF